MSTAAATASAEQQSTCNLASALCAALAFENLPSFRSQKVHQNNSPSKRSMVQSQSLGKGILLRDNTGVDIFYDAVEYYEDDAASSVIDIGSSPIVPSKRALKQAAAAAAEQAPKKTVSPTRPALIGKLRGGSRSPPPSSARSMSASNSGSPAGAERPQSFDAPPPPVELPLRFLRAGKEDPVEGQSRYEETLAWRKEYGMDEILKKPHEQFAFIKEHYPQYFHLRGLKNEPVWYEKPPQVNLKALRDGGVGLDPLLRHYALVTEFGWQYLERDDFARSITIIDLEGMRFTDFAGEVVDFVRKASAFTGQHYPERASCVFVINVPSWFKMIWTGIKAFIDEVTLKKIYILRGKDEIFNALQERIPVNHIPPEYGGTSVPLGESPEEVLLRKVMEHNNKNVGECMCCNGPYGNPPCKFCTWAPVRSY